MLLDSLNIAAKSMNAASVAIQVAGQNLTNSSTPGYVREQVILASSYPKQTTGGYTIGSGVDVTGVIQMIDQYLEERLRTSQSDAMNTSTQSNVYNQLEFILNELTDSDLSTQLDNFFNAIGDVLNQPESLSIRQICIDEAGKLVEMIQKMSSSILTARVDINKSIADTADEINRLTSEIANLNNAIAKIEAAERPGVEAVGLRDDRLLALSELSALINIKTHEDENGVVTVYCGGDALVTNNGARKVTVGYNTDPYGDLSLAEIRFESNNAALDIYSGKLNGMYEGRDAILGGFSEQLDEYVGSLIREFNKLYASGQGLTGYEELTGLTGVKDADTPLDQLGLFEQPKSGVFSVLVQDTVSGTATTTEIRVDFSGTNGTKTTLNDIVDALNAIDGISAKLTSDNRLKITSTSAEKEFAFANDTANVLAALGLNTFFTGTDSRTIGINSTLKTDPGKLAVSASGIGADTENGVRLAAMPETRLSGLGNKSITESYRVMVIETMSKAGTIKAVATGDISYYTSLSAQRNSICGVDIDEETVSLLNFQRMYQATAKYVTVINEMLDALIAM